MAMGTVFTKEGIKKIRSRSGLQAKRTSFRRIKERLMNTKTAQNHLVMESATMDSLYEMKQAKRAKERFRKRFFAMLRLAILVALVVWVIS